MSTTTTAAPSGLGVSELARTRIASVPTEQESHTQTLADLVDDLGWVRQRTKFLLEDGMALLESTTQQASDGLHRLLRQRSSQAVGRDVRSLLDELAATGLSWRTVARLAGVSVPAIRKWRHGEAISGQNRRRVAHLVAVFAVLSERFPHVEDVAGWLEAPLDPRSAVRGLDLLADGREDLVFRYGGGDDPEELLDEYMPEWRQGSNVEVFVASDGLPAIRPTVET